MQWVAHVMAIKKMKCLTVHDNGFLLVASALVAALEQQPIFP
jgi:hypothetical protein